MKKALWLVTLALSLAASQAQAWEEISRKDGVIVSQKDVPDRGLPVFRGEAVIDAPIHRLLAILSDFDRHCEWMYGCKEARLLKAHSRTHLLSYNRTDAPWPVSDRDVVLECKVHIKPEAHTVLVNFHGVRSPLQPEVEDVVRIPTLRGYYRMTALGAARTRVRYEVDADPGGDLPDWVARMVSEDMPYNTLTNLRKRAANASLDQTYDDFYQHWLPTRNPAAPNLIPADKPKP
jgi:hypothetical protein